MLNRLLLQKRTLPATGGDDVPVGSEIGGRLPLGVSAGTGATSGWPAAANRRPESSVQTKLGRRGQGQRQAKTLYYIERANQGTGSVHKSQGQRERDQENAYPLWRMPAMREGLLRQKQTPKRGCFPRCLPRPPGSRRPLLTPWWALDRPPDRAFEARTTLELGRIYIYCCIFNEIQIRRAPFGFSLCFQ